MSAPERNTALRWFGQPWPYPDVRAPVCEDDAAHVPTPAGERCLSCEKEIVPGDRGVIMGVFTQDHTGKPVAERAPMHLECLIRQVVPPNGVQL